MRPQAADSAPVPRAEVVPPEPVPTTRRWVVRDVVPWLTSLLVHVAVVLLGVTAARVILAPPRAKSEVQVTIPENAGVADDRDALPNLAQQSASTEDFLRTAAQDRDAEHAADGVAQSPGASIDFTAGGATGGASDTPIPMIGGPNAFGGPPGGGTGGTGGSDDGGRGGPLARFGLPDKGGGTKLFPPAARARRVIYLCDASGSMIGKFASLREELARAIGKLTPGQAFNVLFFQDGKLLSLDASALVMANPENRRRAVTFFEDVTTAGSTNPIPGLEAAFRQQPDLIYLLTDGDFQDNAAVLARIRVLNKDHRVRVNTIAFVDDHDSDTMFLKLLETIAGENLGTFKHVNMSELGE